jgi:hypothetical protein
MDFHEFYSTVYVSEAHPYAVSLNFVKLAIETYSTDAMCDGRVTNIS